MVTWCGSFQWSRRPSRFRAQCSDVVVVKVVEMVEMVEVVEVVPGG